VLCRVVVLGGLEPFVFVKSIFISVLLLDKKNRQTQTGLAFGNRCGLRRIVLPTGDCAVWWKDRESFTLDTYVGLCDREQILTL